MIHPADLVASNLYAREEDVWRDALRASTWARPEVKREVAIRRYQEGAISLAKAAWLAGMAFEEMKDYLAARGIEIRLGPERAEEIRREAELLRESAGESPGE